MRGAGRATFAAVLLLIAGTLNIIYGIGALSDANIFHNGQRYVFSNLNTLGWVLLVLGVLQLTGGFSLMAGNTYGRIIGITGASLEAVTPVTGAARVVQCAPKVALALGYDVDAALERHDL